jgi:tetratricopeptide (TPR) repeat protein
MYLTGQPRKDETMKRRAADLQTQLQRALRTLQRGQYRQAVRQLERLLPLAQDDPATQEQIYLAMADALLSLQEFSPAIRYATAALNLNPDSERAHYLLGFSYSAQNNWSQAIPPLRRAAELNPAEAEYYRSLGWALYNQGQAKAEGLALLEKALQLAPTYIPILTNLAMLHGLEHRFDQALTYARRAVELAPTYPLAREVLARLTQFKREFERLGAQKKTPKAPARPTTEAEWRELIANTDDFKQVMQLWLELHPAKDLDEANASMRVLNDLWNSTPRPELGNRSPNQMMGRDNEADY